MRNTNKDRKVNKNDTCIPKIQYILKNTFEKVHEMYINLETTDISKIINLDFQYCELKVTRFCIYICHDILNAFLKHGGWLGLGGCDIWIVYGGARFIVTCYFGWVTSLCWLPVFTWCVAPCPFHGSQDRHMIVALAHTLAEMQLGLFLVNQYSSNEVN